MDWLTVQPDSAKNCQKCEAEIPAEQPHLEKGDQVSLRVTIQ